VAEGGLQRDEVDSPGGEEAAEGVAQLVPRKRPKAGGLAGGDEAAAQGGAVEALADGVGGDVVGRPDEVLAGLQPGEGLGGVAGERDGADLAGFWRCGPPRRR
jgi:hypothetical protein